MASPPHLVSVHPAALVQTEHLQVGQGMGGPAGGQGCPGCSTSPPQVFLFYARWSDGRETLVHKSWEEFRGLHVSA